MGPFHVLIFGQSSECIIDGVINQYFRFSLLADWVSYRNGERWPVAMPPCVRPDGPGPPSDCPSTVPLMVSWLKSASGVTAIFYCKLRQPNRTETTAQGTCHSGLAPVLHPPFYFARNVMCQAFLTVHSKINMGCLKKWISWYIYKKLVRKCISLKVVWKIRSIQCQLFWYYIIYR